MCAFSTTTLDPTILDPRKRVRYATGLVLGVDELQQEQTYFMERDRRHQRTLHGYGTVHGLDVRARLRGGEPEVTVAPGIAVDVVGRDVCVPALQCARLNAWLAEHAGEVAEAFGSLPGGSFPDGSFPDADVLPLWVLLCYRECETDAVPIPGSPCRSEDDALAPSRIADQFELRLAFAPPAYAEEMAVRRFGRLLRRLRIGDDAPTLTPEALADLVRALPTAADGGPQAPLFLPPDEAADLIRLAFRIWTVEVRPQLGGEGGCAPPLTDGCVVLARLDLALVPDGDGYRIDATAPAGPDGVPGVTVRQEGRPYLLSTRVLQEWLAHFCGCPAGLASGSLPDSFPEPDVLLALNDLIDVETAPSDGDVLTWDEAAGAWVAAPPAGGGGGVTDHGALTGLGDDDHPQYHTDARGDARYALLGHTHSFPALTDLDAGGDLDGLYPDPTVVRLQGRPVSPNAPAGANPVLRWNGAQWAPFDLQIPAPAESNFEEDLVRIVATSWPHGGVDDLRVNVDGNDFPGLVVAFGFRGPSDGGRVLVRDGSLDAQSFQLFRETDVSQELYAYQGIRPSARFNRRIVPVRLDDISGATWRVTVASEDEPAEAAYFPLNVEALEFGGRLRVVIHGDVVLDADGRALDAEFLRGRLPTGDRPEGVPIGLQGGRFESWLTFGEPVRRPLRLVDVNGATRDELMTLPGIGPALADRIIEARDRGEVFRRGTDLTRLAGVPERTVTDLQGRLRFDR